MCKYIKLKLFKFTIIINKKLCKRGADGNQLQHPIYIYIYIIRMTILYENGENETLPIHHFI